MPVIPEECLSPVTWEACERRRKAGRMPVRCFGAVDFSCVWLRVVGGCASCDRPAALSCATLKEEERDSLARRIVVEWDHWGERGHIIRQTLSTISENVSEYIKLFSKMIFVSGLVLFTIVKQKNKISQTYLVCLRVRKTLLTVFVISVVCFSFSFCRSSVGSALPRRRCCAYITIGMICIFIGVGLTVSTISVSVWGLVHKKMLSKLKPQSASQRKRLARINQEEEQQSRSDKGERTYRNARCTLWHSYHGDV